MFKLHRYTIHCNGCESEMERIVLVSLHVFFFEGGCCFVVAVGV